MMTYNIILRARSKKRGFTGVSAERIKEILCECADTYEWHVDEVKLRQYYAGIVIHFGPEVVPEYVIDTLRMESSRVLQKEFPELISSGSNSFWSKEYFIQTLGTLDQAAVEKYLQAHR